MAIQLTAIDPATIASTRDIIACHEAIGTATILVTQLKKCNAAASTPSMLKAK